MLAQQIQLILHKDSQVDTMQKIWIRKVSLISSSAGRQNLGRSLDFEGCACRWKWVYLVVSKVNSARSIWAQCYAHAFWRLLVCRPPHGLHIA